MDLSRAHSFVQHPLARHQKYVAATLGAHPTQVQRWGLWARAKFGLSGLFDIRHECLGLTGGSYRYFVALRGCLWINLRW
jgi:hypothetical protein